VKILSLFDGISCGQVALHRAGIKPSMYFASEIDRHAIKVTQHNHPETIQLGDVVGVRHMAEAGVFDGIDLVMGGSPCQGFSNAGAGGGFNDPRSALFYEFVRIVRAIKPRWFLLENVKMKNEWLDIISNQMGVQPVFINSADFSAQNRQRYYWTNIPVAPWIPVSTILGDVIDSGRVDREKSYAIDANYAKGTNVEQYLRKSRRQIVFTDDGFRKLSVTES